MLTGFTEKLITSSFTLLFLSNKQRVCLIFFLTLSEKPRDDKICKNSVFFHVKITAHDWERSAIFITILPKVRKQQSNRNIGIKFVCLGASNVD